MLNFLQKSFQTGMGFGIAMQSAALEVPLSMAEAVGVPEDKVTAVRDGNQKVMKAVTGIFEPLYPQKEEKSVSTD